WEWCLNKYDNPMDVSVDNTDERRVLRGGAWYSEADRSRCAIRDWDDPWSGYYDRGFRCCATDSLSF
ncbi:MAG: SUMF1/EgtB/PvdO family nonheme iron enzyme, partial [Ardenticatenaceae bacterium]|nr:SUMF1/EgtB/PvdO family nonheme iron enzyme [Ardenticatenaceae bacterium]